MGDEVGGGFETSCWIWCLCMPKYCRQPRTAYEKRHTPDELMPNRRLNINESMRRVVGRDRGHHRDGGHPQNRVDQEGSFRHCHWWISPSRSTTETSVEMQHSETSLAHKWGPLVVLRTRITFRSGRAAIFNNINLEYALGHCRVNKNTRIAIWELISRIYTTLCRMFRVYKVLLHQRR